MINPGELVQGHQKLNSECFSCHTAFSGISNEKCISCHPLSDIGKDTLNKELKTLFHQQLSDQKCSSCHTDHLGIIPEHSLSGFKHELLTASVIANCSNCHNKPKDNLHSQVSNDCGSCHQNQDWKNTISFNHDLLLNKSNCVTCHQKPADNYHASINENCDKCHNTKKWVPSTFDHSAYFTLDRKHNATCNTCHVANNFNTVTCYGCHEHNERNVLAEHNEEGIYNISNCASCHKSGNEHDIKSSGKRLNNNEQNKVKDYIKSHDKEDNDDD